MDEQRDEDGPGTPPGPLRIAAALVLLEGLALLGGGAFLVYDTFAGTPSDIARALLGAALAIGTSVGLGFGARALLRMQPAARTPIVVVQLVSLPVAYSLGFQAGLIWYGGPILVVALAVLYLLFSPPVRAVFDRNPLGR